MSKEATVNTSPAVKVKKKRKAASLDVQKSRMGWLFVAPFLIGFVLVYLPMIFDSLRYSFGTIVRGVGGAASTVEWVGLENYQHALAGDPEFSTILITSIKELLFNVPAIVIFSLFMAVMLNQKMHGRAVFRAIFFIPVIVSTGIIESIDLQNTLAENMENMNTTGTELDTGDSGNNIINIMDIQGLFQGMAIGGGLVNYVLIIVNDVYGIVGKSGVQMLIFLAGLQSISPAIYEACKIDGATGWETFWKITFPMISPMILVNAVYTIIDSFTVESNTVMSYISGIISKSEVLGTAMSWIYFLIVVLILAAVAGIMSMYVFYQRKD